LLPSDGSELKKSLYQLFSQFGNILEVVAQRTYKMRGQAWVIFEDLQGATRAVREINNFMFFGKPLVRERSTANLWLGVRRH